MISSDHEKLYDVFKELKISFESYEHEPVFTLDDAKKIEIFKEGVQFKNLFLKDRRGKNYFLVMLNDTKKVDLKNLSEKLFVNNLSFASESSLKEYLGLEKGAVSPFGLINDKQHKVRLIVDNDFKNAEKISLNPNINTVTVIITRGDLIKFLDYLNIKIEYFNF